MRYQFWLGGAAALVCFVSVSTNALAADYFGSLYYSPSTGAHGWGNNYSSREIAEAIAFQNCAQHATDCTLLFWVQNQCGSFAQGSGAGSPPNGFAWNGDSNVAERDALAKCSANGAGCKIIATFCAGR